MKPKKTIKQKRKRKIVDLHIDPKNTALARKWSPKTEHKPTIISRATDIARKYQIGMAEVLTKIKQLGITDVSRTTKLPPEILELIERDGMSENYWPTLRTSNDRKIADPLSRYGKKKKIRHQTIGKRKKNKKKSRTGPPPILTPSGGQPGYRIRYQFK
jgi:hypothetical protein